MTLDDVGGLEVLKAWLRSRVLAFDAGARAFGLAEPRGMLVCGVQGCGKSLVSKATARVLSLPLVRLDFAEVFADASPEHAIHEATRAVEAVAPVVLWVDEIEKGLGADARRRAARPRLRRVPHVAAGASRAGVRGRHGQRGGAAASGARPARALRRGVLRGPALAEGARADPRGAPREGAAGTPTPTRSAELAKDLEHWSGAEIEQMVDSGLFRAYVGISQT